MNNNIITIDSDEIVVRLSTEHEYVLNSKEVALGYGVSYDAIRQHKSRHEDELVEGKHFLTVTDSHSHAGKGPQSQILWTKRGVIRLGFFIKSARAKKFRDAAEDLIIRETAPQQDTTPWLQQMAEGITKITDVVALHDHKLATLGEAWRRVVLGQHNLEQRLDALTAEVAALKAQKPKPQTVIPIGNRPEMIAEALRLTLGDLPFISVKAREIVTTAQRHHLPLSLGAIDPANSIGKILHDEMHHICPDGTVLRVLCHGRHRHRRYIILRNAA